MRRTLWGVLVALLASAGSATSLHGQDDTLRVTLAEARRLALTENPAFLAYREERGIAEGRLREARTYPYNPEIELEAPGSISNGVEGYEAWLWQEVEWAGQPGLRSDAAERGLRSAQATVEDAARRTLAQVSVAFYAARAARSRVDVAQEYLALNTRLLKAVRTQAAEGEISVMEANFAEIETGRARALVLGNEREAIRASLELGRLIGLPPGRIVRPEDSEDPVAAAETLSADSLADLAVSRRPDLAARIADERRAAAQTRLAGRLAVPNIRLGAVLDRDPENGARSWGFGAGLSVPLWNRNRGEVATSAARGRQAAFARQAVELRIRTEVEQALAAFRIAEREAEIYSTDVLEPARENQALLDTAYRAGRIGLPELVLLRNQLLQGELDYWRAWFTLRATWIELQSATGALVAPRSTFEDN